MSFVLLLILASCDPTLFNHVYHKERLIVKNPCISVTGTFVDATHGKRKDGCRHEADSDLHCWIRLDPGQESLLSPGNIEHQESNLVWEPICIGKVTQEDAKAACKDFKQNLHIPLVGSHVRITGAWVFDLQHQHSEIHPVTSIEVLPPGQSRAKLAPERPTTGGLRSTR